MEMWCRRLPRWSPEYAYRALLKVQPFGRANGVVALLVYQWLRRSWADPKLPPGR